VKLGRYEVVRELGKGAMGIVYLAKDPLIGRLVALKTIRPAQGDEDETNEFQQRFVREAQAAGILNHPAIVTVFDIGVDEASGVSFIAMEYVEGQNLKEVLAQGRPFTFQQTADIIAQVAEALDFAHAKGIVHRDVKPANIILLDGTRAKIMDFGIAKIASGGNLTTTGQFLGTPNYMAPEQIKGSPVDGRTDIFALGICLYECLTHRKPFGGDSLTSISYKIVHEDFPPLGEINPQIPDSFQDVVARCLAKDPGKRYQRARDVGLALRAIARGETPLAVEPMQAEETLLTRDKIPTIEVPFPEAVEAEDPRVGGQTFPAAAPPLAPAAAGLPAPPSAAAAKAAARRPGAALQLRKTFSNVRAMPLWRRPVRPAVFIGIAAILAIVLLAAVVGLRGKQVPARAIDVKAEKQRARERELRNQANALASQGQIAQAYEKYQQLHRLAPNSPAVMQILQNLDTRQAKEETSRQQLAQAKQKLDEGLALFNKNNYAESIPLFEESFHINPNSDEAANYLKLAQHAQQIAEQEKAMRAPARSTPAVTASVAPAPRNGGTRTAADGARTINNAPAQLNTVFNNSSINDGYILVKVGSQVVAHENLWEETVRFFSRRKSPHAVNVTKEFPAVNADLDVWVVVPSLNIQEHKVFRQNFQPGVEHKLTVSFDAASKKLDFQFN
jgi:tetratricopeptide (TPR) repeat protein/predicted Ser/Thr protein kinase